MALAAQYLQVKMLNCEREKRIMFEKNGALHNDRTEVGWRQVPVRSEFLPKDPPNVLMFSDNKAFEKKAYNIIILGIFSIPNITVHISFIL